MAGGTLETSGTGRGSGSVLKPTGGVSQQLLREPVLGGPRRGTRPPKRRVTSAHTTLSAHGAPLVWLTGGALATAMAMIVGLLVLVVYQGLQTFWPLPVVQMEVSNNSGSGPSSTLMGEIARAESFRPEPGFLEELKQHSPELFAKQPNRK